MAGLPSSYLFRKFANGGGSSALRHERVFARFSRNPGLERALASNAQMRNMAMIRAEKAAAEARDLAPFRTGHYKAGIKAVEMDGPKGWEARVVAGDFKSIWIEFGTIRQPPQAVLKRGCEAAGLQLRPPGREASGRAPR